MASKQLAALIVTLLAILGSVASQQQQGPYCFNGWIPQKLLPSMATRFCIGGSGSPKPVPRPPPSESGLSDSSSYCPNAEGLVKKVVADAIDQRGRGIGAGIIRLFFHDCFVRGCDASVLLNTTASGNSDTEREGPPNQNSLRGFEVIDAAKAAVEAEPGCSGKVSCADILAFAARDASAILSDGKINIRMPGGRRDGRESFANETGQLPGPFSTLQQLKDSFAAQDLSAEDMITLSGAHTIGRARCLFFSNRLNSSSMDADFAEKLREECKTSGTRVNQDVQTPNDLDNKYYQNVIANKVLFDSDDALKTEGEVQDNARIPGRWERKFEKAMEKMGRIIDDRSRKGGEIRKVCWAVNRPGGY